MELYLLRHGIAEDQSSTGRDDDRELTPDGRKKLRDTLKVAANAGVKPSLLMSSPLVRAVQTAEIAAEMLAYKNNLAQTEALVPDSSPERVWEEVRLHREIDKVMIVGHEPLFSTTVAFLLASPALLVDFKKGAIVRIDFGGFGPQPRGVLRWMVVPKLVG